MGGQAGLMGKNKNKEQDESPTGKLEVGKKESMIHSISTIYSRLWAAGSCSIPVTTN